MPWLIVVTVLGLWRQTAPPPQWTDADWHVLDSKVRWAVKQKLDSVPIGTAIVRLAESFVGATYRPGTLEAPGPERVIVNLRQFDCVTFVENILAMTRLIREDGVALLANRPAAQVRYAGYLEELRYRGGHLNGYPSRLHYFSEWMSDNASRGRLQILARRMRGAPVLKALNFMSTHASNYRQLADPAVHEAIRDMEVRINTGPPPWYIGEADIARVAELIHDGDIVAATSVVPGLDVAHTGIAMWRNGKLHLVHAPLVGKVVEISVLPLAERIIENPTQDGIMVARVVK